MKLVISRNQVAGEYNFVADPTNGAIGVIALDVQVPTFSKIVGFRVTTLTAWNGAAGCNISFGLRQIGVTGVPITNITALFPVAGFALFNQVDGSGNFKCLNIIDFGTNPIKLSNDWEIVMGISGAAVLAGRAQVELEYTQMNF